MQNITKKHQKKEKQNKAEEAKKLKRWSPAQPSEYIYCGGEGLSHRKLASDRKQ